MSKPMKLPRPVMMQKERIDALVKELDKNQHAPVEEVPPEEPKPEEVEVKKEPEPVVVEDTKKTPEELGSKDASYWEHRFKTNQGMFNAYKEQQAQRVTQLEDELKAIKSKLTETVAQVPKEYDLRKYMSEEDINSYGEGMLKTILKTAVKIADERSAEQVQATVQEQIAPIQRELENTRQTAAQQTEQRFWGTINQAVPNWQAVNVDKAFHQWLNEREGLTDFTRDDLLKDAQKKLDADKVVMIFNAFLKNRTPLDKGTVQKSLEKKVVPETVSSSGTDIPNNEVEPVAKSYISKFYTDKTLGRYRNRPELEKQIEKKINAAYLANRVIDG